MVIRAGILPCSLAHGHVNAHNRHAIVHPRLSLHGDPAKNIRDTRNITTVIKGGKVYDPAAIEKALSIAPRPAGR